MRVTVIGTGYVGLVSGVCLAHLGHHVTCVDLDKERVSTINKGNTPIAEPGLEDLLRAGLQNGRFSATTDLRSSIQTSNITMIAVGTPFGDGRIDLSFVLRAARDLGSALRETRDYHVAVIKSTVVPTTTESVVADAIAESSGKNIGVEIGLATNPEFLQEGFAVDNFLDPDRVVIGGVDERSTTMVADLYASFDCPIVLTTPSNAEMIKYTSNALLATLISFSNEIAGVCETIPGLDVETVMEGLHLDRRLSPLVNDQRIRPGILSYLKAGYGFGGSCLPKDVQALQSFAASHGVAAPLLAAVMSINESRAKTLVARARGIVGDLADRRIAVLGVAFKPGTDDTRDSPALRVIEELLDLKAHVHVFDPLAKVGPEYDGRVSTAESIEEAMTGASAAFLTTAWPEFVSADWRQLILLMQDAVIVDGRNALRNISWPADVRYLPIGRC